MDILIEVLAISFLIILFLIFVIAISATIKKVNKDGFKSIDQWNEIQALTNIGVVISLFFLIFSFYLTKESQEISIKQSDENITLMYKRLEIDLTKYEYLKWENHFLKDKENSIIFTAHKGANDDDLKCFDVLLYPIFINKSNGIATDYNDYNAIVLTYNCIDEDVIVNYEEDKIIIRITDFNRKVYEYSPKNNIQVLWLSKDLFSLYGYYSIIDYYPSLYKQNKCRIEGINIMQREKSTLIELNWR